MFPIMPESMTESNFEVIYYLFISSISHRGEPELGLYRDIVSEIKQWVTCSTDAIGHSATLTGRVVWTVASNDASC